MSNFKEIYPQINFREDLHRMDSLGEDNYEVWAYNGDPDFAPLSSDYSYELVKNTKAVSGRNITITDSINMPIESFKLYGEANYDWNDDYIKLQYIDNEATAAYIDTGIIADSDLKLEIDFQFLPGRASGYTNSFGAIGEISPGIYRRWHIQGGNNGNGVELQYVSASTTPVFRNKPFTTRAYTIIDMKEKTVQTEVDNEIQEYAISYNGDWSSEINFWLFRRSGIPYNNALRVYSCKMYKNGEKLRDFIPVKKKSNNEIGMLDLVTNTFYSKQGNGTLIGGPEANLLDIKTVGIWNPSTNYYEIRCYDNIENMIFNSKTFSGWTIGNGWVKDDTKEYTEYSFSRDTSTANQWVRLIPTLRLDWRTCPNGVTVSFDLKIDDINKFTNGVICALQCWDSNNTRLGWYESNDIRTGVGYNINVNNMENNKWVRVACYFTLSQLQTIYKPAEHTVDEIAYTNFSFQLVRNGSIHIRKVKCELGNQNTAYSLNHNDSDYIPLEQLIYSPQPLSSLQNGVRDYYDNGWLYLSTIYDYFKSLDNWEIERTLSNNNILVVSLFKPNATKSSTDIWCTHFRANEDLSGPNRVKIDNQRIYISLDKTIYPDLDTWLHWLQDNIVTICYQRKNTLKIASEPAVLLHTYDEVTNIINDQDAEMEIEYRVAPNARIWERQEDGTFKELTS